MTNPTAATLAQVRAFVEGNMGSQVKVLRGTRGTFDPATGIVGGLAGALTVYQGKARIRDLNGQVIQIGEGYVDTGSTIISIPITAPLPHRDDLVQVLDNVDLEIVTRTFHVDEVQSSGFWADAHRMSCTAWLESSRWGE